MRQQQIQQQYGSGYAVGTAAGVVEYLRIRDMRHLSVQQQQPPQQQQQVVPTQPMSPPPLPMPVAVEPLLPDDQGLTDDV